MPVLAGMEAAGIRVDAPLLAELSRDFAERAGALAEECFELAGREFNLASPRQLGAVLFDELGLPHPGRRGKSGARSTDHAVLEDLAAEGHILPGKILKWRELAKLRSTYADALQKRIHPETGRVHTRFSQIGAATGRFSSSDPNLQNIPVRTAEGRRLREAFIAEEGRLLLSVDYSQIELRLAAEITGEGALLAAFRRGEDIHAATAAEIFSLPPNKVPPERRREAKAINFGILYGISPFGLARSLNIPQAEARAFMDSYFKRYPAIQGWMEAVRKEVRRSGRVETAFGRIIHLPQIRSGNPAQRRFAERAAINAPIQGTAADIIRRAMIRLPEALARAGLSARLLLQVHDELLLEVEEAELEAASAVVCEVMEGAHAPGLNLALPLVAEAGSGRTWAEAH